MTLHILILKHKPFMWNNKHSHGVRGSGIWYNITTVHYSDLYNSSIPVHNGMNWRTIPTCTESGHRTDYSNHFSWNIAVYYEL
jgi:hypothetical protein